MSIIQKTVFIALFVFIIVLIIGSLGIEPKERGRWYQKYLIDVNCGDKFKGKVYKMGHTTAGIYSIWYQTEDGNKIELPDEGCVKITIKEIEPK